MTKPTLKDLYQEMAEYTRSYCAAGALECSRFVDRPHRCCAPQYCETAAKFAKEKYGIDLPRTGNELPFMGEQGCTIPPYLRPICALHLCSISWSDRSTVMNDPGKTAEYFRLRQEILERAKVEGKEP